MTARLPSPGSDSNNWGTLLNDYLQQSLAADGTLVTASTNPYTATANTNLATTLKPGLVKLANDLGGTSLLPTVTGLQGRILDSAAPNSGDVVTWDSSNSKWKPAAPPGAAGGLTMSQVLAINSLGI
jgi:hypothetical protein